MNNKIDTPYNPPSMLDALRSYDATDSVPKFMHGNAIKLERAVAQESERKRVPDEVVCRLLASDMIADEIAVILRIKQDVVAEISDRCAETVKKYRKTLK